MVSTSIYTVHSVINSTSNSSTNSSMFNFLYYTRKY
jgi:hypothetical protein